MKQFSLYIVSAWLELLLALGGWSPTTLAAPPPGNRLNYRDEANPFDPHLGFPKLTTPQWLGEIEVEAAVILAIDDMRQPDKYEAVLRPILERLKRIDGRAPVSILCNELDPTHPHLQNWLQEGVSLEVHTLAHPCPLLSKSNFVAAAQTYHGSVELMNRVPGNRPVAFRMPCCDSINSPSPRFYFEMMARTNGLGQFLTIDSSIMQIFTADDPGLKREWTVDEQGQPKFRKYLPFPSFTTTIENYPYPYVIGNFCWEFPAMVPSDWEAQHLHGTNNPATVRDWKVALDATVAKQGAFTFIFHPHGWIRPDQMVEFIDYAVERYGQRVKFLTFREAEERLNRYLLAGNPLRTSRGEDNGVRLLDVNNDGYLDVVIGNEATRKTRLWQPAEKHWHDVDFPTALVTHSTNAPAVHAGVQFGVVRPDGKASAIVNADLKGAWEFDGENWTATPGFWAGLSLAGEPIRTRVQNRDRGVRLRDIDGDGQCEVVVGNDHQNTVFKRLDEGWRELGYRLPDGTALVDAQGRDAGLRLVDINGDGYDDALFSNADRYSLHLFVPKLYLGFQPGWSRVVLSGAQGEPGAIPKIVQGGAEPNNGAWFAHEHLWVQNENTAGLPDLVDRRSYTELLAGLQPKPKSPEEALASMNVRPGFKIELVACEPLVKDPIAFEWGPDGKLWVVEMGDYPLGLDGKGKSGGIVRFLEDTDGDGRYDKSTVFLDNLNFPTGVMPWRNGVLVSAAPEIFYAEDRDGDGKSDVRIPLLTGFTEGNQQHRLNGFDYGLDNWVHGANGDSGGNIRLAGTVPGAGLGAPSRPTDLEVNLRGFDFRFRPDEGLFETVSGQTQYGRHRDDWGNWFGNNNPTWLWHVILPEHYLERNPHLPVKAVKQYLANYPDSTRVFARSRSMQRFNDVAMLNHVTSANSPTPYRDDLFGSEFEGSVFISEPVHNVIHREVLQVDGVTFQSHRGADEAQIEFVASTDNWFRPTMLKTGPDGALYIADMYRLVLEHPEWIPPDAQKALDLRAGSQLGRIYRVYPNSASLRPIPRLAGLKPEQWVDFLDSPNGWTRDTAQRLLVHAGEGATVSRLLVLQQRATNPKVRLQVLCTLDGLQKLTPGILNSALQDPHPSVREHAIRLSEGFLHSGRRLDPTTHDDLQRLQERLLALVHDPSLRVRFQLAFTLGEWQEDKASRALVQLAVENEADPQIQTAVLSSTTPHCKTMLQFLLHEDRIQPPAELIRQLLTIATAQKQDATLAEALAEIAKPVAGEYLRWQWLTIAGFLDGVERQDGALRGFRERSSPDLKRAIDELAPLFLAARKAAADDSRNESDRVTAIRLLGRGLGEPDDIEIAARLLKPQVTAPLKGAALAALGRVSDGAVAARLLESWSSYEPTLRGRVLTLLLSRVDWTSQLLQHIESGQIPPAQISPADQQKMLNSSTDAIRDRSQKVFAVAKDRLELQKQYAAALELNSDASKGAAIFRQNCASCHRFREEGIAVGPDLGALANKSPQTLLAAILDPNRAVEARYVNYTAATRDDREVTGIITAESPSSVTLRAAGGIEETLLRNDLRELSSSGLSLMPEGFERVMTPQDLADLIGYLGTL